MKRKSERQATMKVAENKTKSIKEALGKKGTKTNMKQNMTNQENTG